MTPSGVVLQFFFMSVQLLQVIFSSCLYLEGMFQAKFYIMTFFSLEFVEGKQQICYQSVICNGTWVLMHCVKNESGLCINYGRCYVCSLYLNVGLEKKRKFLSKKKKKKRNWSIKKREKTRYYEREKTKIWSQKSKDLPWPTGIFCIMVHNA